jgi:hypothetical protein
MTTEGLEMPPRLPVAVAQIRAADTDRLRTADLLERATSEGRLTLSEFEERVSAIYTAKTHAELADIVSDLPATGDSRGEEADRSLADAYRRSADRLWSSLTMLWVVWAAAVALNVTVWAMLTIALGGGVHPWPVWVAVPPGVALLSATAVVRVVRKRRQDRRIFTRR